MRDAWYAVADRHKSSNGNKSLNKKFIRFTQTFKHDINFSSIITVNSCSTAYIQVCHKQYNKCMVDL